MDIREQQQHKQEKKIELPDQQKILENIYILKEDKLMNEKKFKDSLIYNLIQKIDKFNLMEAKFNKQLSEQVGSLSELSWARMIHIPYMPIYYVAYTGYTVITKKFRIANNLRIICIMLMLNQYSRYKRITGLDHELYQQYIEHKDNYGNLMKKARQNLTYSQMLLHLTGIDMQRQRIKESLELLKQREVNYELIVSQCF